MLYQLSYEVCSARKAAQPTLLERKEQWHELLWQLSLLAAPEG